MVLYSHPTLHIMNNWKSTLEHTYLCTYIELNLTSTSSKLSYYWTEACNFAIHSIECMTDRWNYKAFLPKICSSKVILPNQNSCRNLNTLNTSTEFQICSAFTIVFVSLKQLRRRIIPCRWKNIYVSTYYASEKTISWTMTKMQWIWKIHS